MGPSAVDVGGRAVVVDTLDDPSAVGDGGVRRRRSRSVRRSYPSVCLQLLKPTDIGTYAAHPVKHVRDMPPIAGGSDAPGERGECSVQVEGLPPVPGVQHIGGDGAWAAHGQRRRDLLPAVGLIACVGDEIGQPGPGVTDERGDRVESRLSTRRVRRGPPKPPAMGGISRTCLTGWAA